MNTLNEDNELNFEDVLIFLKQQYKNIFVVFISVLIICFIFIFSRPTLYKSSCDLVINKDIESVEQIKFLYGSKTEINSIKNTSLIQITSISKNLEESKNNVEETKNKILSNHEQIRNNRIQQASQFLKAIQNDNKKELIDILEKSSAINSTKQITLLETTTLKYGGLLKKGIIYSILLSLTMSLIFALITHNVKKITKILKNN
jgi:uncharacterized protein involved in exopolysaccharide biosynthesis